MPESFLKKRQRSFRRRFVRGEAWFEDLCREAGVIPLKQAIVGPYIVDFVFKDRLLVVEIDDPSHDSKRAQTLDRARDVFLGKCGFSVLRFRQGEAIDLLQILNSRPKVTDREIESAFKRGMAFKVRQKETVDYFKGRTLTLFDPIL